MERIASRFAVNKKSHPHAAATASRIGGAALLMALGLSGAGWSQGFTKADSGWVRLFNGTDFTGIYSRLYGQPVTETPDPSWVILYPGTDTAVIRGSSTSKQGNIGTKKNTFSHYRMRVEYRHDVQNGNNNAGLTYHTDESAPRMQNNWPRSIECQMKQSESGSAFSIQQVAFDTRASGTGEGSNWMSTGGTVVTACEFGCNGRWYKGSPLISGGTQWNRMEIVVRGSDSAIHMVNGTVVFKLWKIRLRSNSGQDQQAWGSGAIGLQAEGALINYRRWEIMELPAGTPAPHILNRLFLTSPNSGVQVNAGATHKITWKSIGSVAKVRLEYNTGTGGWKPVTIDSVPNNGSYDWLVPAENTSTLKVRVAGPAWAVPDTSDGNNSIGPGTSIHAAKEYSGFVTVAGLVAKDGQTLEILGTDGRLVRTLVLQSGQRSFVPTWDRRDNRGQQVRPGIYVARLSGAPRAVTRILVY